MTIVFDKYKPPHTRVARRLVIIAFATVFPYRTYAFDEFLCRLRREFTHNILDIAREYDQFLLATSVTKMEVPLWHTPRLRELHSNA